MLSNSENILQTLTGKSSLHEVNKDELKRIADQYPYFGAAQLLVAKKLFQEKENYKPAAQKAVLHFADILWFNYNFLEEEFSAVESVTVPEIFPDIESDKTEEVEIINEDSQEVASITEQHALANLQTDEVEVLDEPVFETANIEIEKETLKEAENFYQLENTELKKTGRLNEESQEVASITEEHEPANLQTDEIDILDEPFSEIENIEIDDELPEESSDKLSNLLKEQAAAFEKPVEETTIPVESTAYHRIDYFESQGIKLDPEKEPDDKLGSQLKRFTDWLKQMKRINPNLNAIDSDAAGESQVQNMAEHSNEPKEIVTEAMAEVLIKQNKPEQAIQIYEKLSFFNPSKSAYFAAKIKELKA